MPISNKEIITLHPEKKNKLKYIINYDRKTSKIN